MAFSKAADFTGARRESLARAGGTWLSRLSARINGMRATWDARCRRARELDDLHRLSDRELRDVGLSRSDFPAVEKGTYRRW